MIDTISSLINNQLTTLLALFWLIFGIYKYFDIRKREQDGKDFERYHKLIETLVTPDKTWNTHIDRQIAIIYELRNLKRYYEPTQRILEWLLDSRKDEDKRLIKEIELSIEYTTKQWFIKRLLKKLNLSNNL